MSEYIDSVVQERARRLEEREIEAKYAQFALSAAPRMFQDLRDAIVADIDHYRRKSNDHSLAVKPSLDSLIVERTDFPIFRMTITLDATIFKCSTTHKDSTSAPETPENPIIEIISKGQDKHYYRVNGKDYAMVGDVSQWLLEPLLRRIP